MAGEDPLAAPAPVDPAPAPAPVDPAPAPAPVDPAPAPAADAPKHPAETPTLLGSFKKAEAEAEAAADPAKPAAEPAPAEPAKAAEPAPAEPAPTDADPAAAVEPIEYKFEFPEHVKPQDEKVAAFTDFAREHKLSPEAAQQAVNYFNDAASAFVAEQERRQIDTWNTMRADWRKEVLAHEVLGGAGHLTAMGIAADARDIATAIMAGDKPGTPKYEAAEQRIENMLSVTGAGDHPVMVEIFHALGSRLAEPRRPTIPPSVPKNNGVRPSNSLYAPKRT